MVRSFMSAFLTCQNEMLGKCEAKKDEAEEKAIDLWNEKNA